MPRGEPRRKRLLQVLLGLACPARVEASREELGVHRDIEVSVVRYFLGLDGQGGIGCSVVCSWGGSRCEGACDEDVDCILSGDNPPSLIMMSILRRS